VTYDERATTTTATAGASSSRTLPTHVSLLSASAAGTASTYDVPRTRTGSVTRETSVRPSARRTDNAATDLAGTESQQQETDGTADNIRLTHDTGRQKPLATALAVQRSHDSSWQNNNRIINNYHYLVGCVTHPGRLSLLPSVGR